MGVYSHGSLVDRGKEFQQVFSAFVGRHLRAESSEGLEAAAAGVGLSRRQAEKQRVSRVTRGTIEAEAANAVVRFQREQQGRGPTDVKAHLTRDLLVVRCTGIFTQTESRLAATDEGKKLIKSARLELRSINHREIEEIIGSIAGCEVVRSYFDIDTDVGETVEVFVLAEDLEKRLDRN